MEYGKPYRQKHYLSDKENGQPAKQLSNTSKTNACQLRNRIDKLEREVKAKDIELQENHHLNNKLKTNLLQVSKKETEEYANNIEIYSKEFQDLNNKNDALSHKLAEYQERESQHQQQLQTLAVGIEQQDEKNRRKDEEISKIQHKNMSLQHDCVILQEQLESLRSNFFNDNAMMRSLCEKLEISSCHNVNDLLRFVSHSKQVNSEYNEMRQSSEQHKIELISYKKQLEIYEDNKNIEKGQLIHMESLRAENENLRKEIRILEESNYKLSNDVIARSEEKMNLMTESLSAIQQEHQKMYSDFEKRIEKVKRERKSYQHKCEHFKKEAKGFATKYEELNQKYSELEQECAIYRRNDDNVSEDYERRMSELEANNDALNQQLQAARHELQELTLLRDNLRKNECGAHREIEHLKHEIESKEHELLRIRQDKEQQNGHLNQLKASKALMETMWNEFKHNQTQQHESLLNGLERKISQNQEKELHRFNEEKHEYQHEIYALKQQIKEYKLDKNQNEQIRLLQEENDVAHKDISELKQRIIIQQNAMDNIHDLTQSSESLMLINNHDTLKQRCMDLKKENIELHKELTQMKRSLENREWQKTLNEQNLKNDIQILETKLCHHESRLKDKVLEIEELKKLLNGVEHTLEEIRNKYECGMQTNAGMESQITNLSLYNESLKGNIQEHKHEIKSLRETMDSWYDKHGLSAVYEKFGDSNSELVRTLKSQNDELRKKVESGQDCMLSLKQDMASLKQSNNALSDRYESNTKVTVSKDSQIEQLRQSLADIQQRENKLTKTLTETKMQCHKYKMQSQQLQTGMIDRKEQNANLMEQIKYLEFQNNTEQQDKFEQFTKLTNKLEMVRKNAEQLKLTNKEMHEQIEYLKKAYEDLDNELHEKENKLADLHQQHTFLASNTKHTHDLEMVSNKYTMLKAQYAKKEDAYLVVSKKYEILKAHWESLNQDRSAAIEQLKTEAQRVSESESKLSTLQSAIATLNHERTKLEKERQDNQELLGKLKLELNNKQMQLENVDEEKLKWKARTDSLAQAQRGLNNQVIITEQKVQDEMRLLRTENYNLKQEVEKKMYEIDDVQNKNKQIGETLNKWKLKYDGINEKYEFETAQHDNTMKKLNDLRAIWDGETNLNQLLQMKQQMIQELQSKLNEKGNNKFEHKYEDILKENDGLKAEIERIQKVLHEQSNVQLSLKTRINVQRNIINQQQQHPIQSGRNGDDNNSINITMNEYHQLQQQLDLLAELQTKYDTAQQEIMELQQQLSRYQDIETDLDTSELIPNYTQNTNNDTVQLHMEQLVAYLHKKEQSLHDLQDEYEGIKTENNALIQNIQTLEQSKIALQNSLKDMSNKLKGAEQVLNETQNKTHSIEGHRDSLAKKLRMVSAGNAKLRVELFSLSSAAELVQEQLKTSAVALSTTTHNKQQLIEEMENLRDTLKSAEQRIAELQNENSELQNYNDNLLNQFHTLKFTHQSLRQSYKDNDNNNHSMYEQQSELINNTMQSMKNGRQKLQKEFDVVQQRYNVAKSETIQVKAKSELVIKQLSDIKRGHDQLSTECFDLKRSIKQMENDKRCMQYVKQDLNKDINTLQQKYCNLFNEHNNLIQQYQATNHEISDMKLEKQTVFIERDLLDYKVAQLKGDKSNIGEQLNQLKASYFGQSNKFKSEHKELCDKYNEISGEREELKIRIEQVLNEKQTLQKMLSTYQQQLDHNEVNKDSKAFEIQQEYDESLRKQSEIASKLAARNIENDELKASYQRITDKLTNAQLKIDELNIVCNERKHDSKYTKDMVQSMKDKLLDKDDECQQLQINYHEQENKMIKVNHDLQTLLKSYNTLSAENEHLHSENQALYEQLQVEQMNKFLENTKLQSNDIINQIDEQTATFNGGTINVQSLVKRGRLLTEQCADLNIDNEKLNRTNKELTHNISELQQQISLLNISNDDDDSKLSHDIPKTIAVADSKAVVLSTNDDIISTPYHEAVLRELRHRNEQLMDQVRSLQHDLETDTELINGLQKENGELRSKLTTFLQRNYKDDPQRIIAVDSRGEPWQDIIRGLRKQLQEARREIAQLCEESMGKTQHINDVESANAQLVKNIDSLEKEHDELAASLAATPKPEQIQHKDENEYEGQLAKQYTQMEELYNHMRSVIHRVRTEQKIKDELKNILTELEDNLAKTKTQCREIEESKETLCKSNEIIQHELSLLKRAKGQLSDHNEQLAKEITNLQSVQFEQQQKISSQQQDLSELQTLYQNIQSQLEIKNSLNKQFQTERHDIVRLFAVTDIEHIMPHPNKNKVVDLGGFDSNEEAKMESMEPSMFEFNYDTATTAHDTDKLKGVNGHGKCEALDLKHEIECLLNNYHKITEKNGELQQILDRNQKEYSIQNDFNLKFEEIKRLLMQRHNTSNDANSFVGTPNSNTENSNTNNGSANYGDNSAPQRLSLSANLSPFRPSSIGHDLNMTNPDLLNTSMQHMEDIMNTHRLMKEEEFEQLVNTKKELADELDAIQTKYDVLSRDYANQTQKLSLLEQEHKHISNQLENICNERNALRSEINNNKTLTDKLSTDFKAIAQERDRLYSKIKSLQRELETKEFDKKEQEYHRLKQEINELNDLNMKQSNQIDLLQNNNIKYEQEVKESNHRYHSITNDFKTIKTKYERLNEEYDNLSSQQQKLYYEMNEIKQINTQKAMQITSVENRLTSAMDECQKYEQQISKNKLKFENDITDYQSKITELELLLDSAKFEMVAKQSSDSNKHIEDLNEQLELLRNKYENRLQQTKTQYSDKIAKMNEAVTKLSAARTQLQNQLMKKEEKYKDELNRTSNERENMETRMNELQTQLEIADNKNMELDDKRAVLLQDCNRRIESALKHKSTVDEELQELHQVHNNKIQGMDTRFEDLLGKYQQSVQENEIIKVAKEQHQLLVKEIDHLHAQLKEARVEHQQLRQKAQLHYTRRKEEWKKLKQLENSVHKKDETINALSEKEMKYMKENKEYRQTIECINEKELNSLCCSIEDTMKKLTDITNHHHDNDNNNKNVRYSVSNLFSFLQSVLISLTSVCTTSEIMMKQFDKTNETDDKYKEELIEIRRQLIDLTKENEKLRFNELNIRSDMEEYKTKINTTKNKLVEMEKLLENERLNWKKETKNNNIEFQELSDKCKIIEQQNTNLRSQIIQLNHDIQELEDENNNLREERRRSLEGNTNEYLAEKINLQRQIRIIREERDIAEKKLKENESKYNQLTLKIHQLQLQFESAQQRVDHLENERRKLNQQLDTKNEMVSTLEAEKIAVSKKNNELYDGNVSLDEKNRKSQQEIGKFQVKADRLRQQRDYAKSKYKELKAKFNSLEQQFRSLQSRYNKSNNNNQNNLNPQTSQTMPF